MESLHDLFVAELQAILRGEKEYPAIDLILYCVRIAKKDHSYVFSNTAERHSWKTIAYPYLYGNSINLSTGRYE
jgi:hypothetical protein